MKGRAVINSVIFTVVTVTLQWALCIPAGSSWPSFASAAPTR